MGSSACLPCHTSCGSHNVRPLSTMFWKTAIQMKCNTPGLQSMGQPGPRVISDYLRCIMQCLDTIPRRPMTDFLLVYRGTGFHYSVGVTLMENAWESGPADKQVQAMCNCSLFAHGVLEKNDKCQYTPRCCAHFCRGSRWHRVLHIHTLRATHHGVFPIPRRA